MSDCAGCDRKRLDEAVKRKAPEANPDWYSGGDGGYSAVTPEGHLAAAVPVERFQPAGFEMRWEWRVIHEGVELLSGYVNTLNEALLHAWNAARAMDIAYLRGKAEGAAARRD